MLKSKSFLKHQLWYERGQVPTGFCSASTSLNAYLAGFWKINCPFLLVNPDLSQNEDAQ